MAIKKTTQEFQIPPLNQKTMKVRIEGTAPIIFHKWSQKAITMILDKQLKKASKGRETRNPEEEYEDSFYYDASDRVAIPARNIKSAITNSARFIEGVQMVLLRGTIFIRGDVDGFIPILVKNKVVTRKDVRRNTSEWMRRDEVTVGMGSADLRFRGQLKEWSAEFLIEFDANNLSAEQVLNLLQRAGFSQGLMEWRPERNGDSGTFKIA